MYPKSNQFDLLCEIKLPSAHRREGTDWQTYLRYLDTQHNQSLPPEVILNKQNTWNIFTYITHTSSWPHMRLWLRVFAFRPLFVFVSATVSPAVAFHFFFLSFLYFFPFLIFPALGSCAFLLGCLMKMYLTDIWCLLPLLGALKCCSNGGEPRTLELGTESSLKCSKPGWEIRMFENAAKIAIIRSTFLCVCQREAFGEPSWFSWQVAYPDQASDLGAFEL